jgi:hypothetical protein
MKRLSCANGLAVASQALENSYSGDSEASKRREVTSGASRNRRIATTELRQRVGIEENGSGHVWF